VKRIPLAKWTPDQFGLANPGQTDVKNCYASGSGYVPLGAPMALSTTPLAGRALGAISAQDATGAIDTFAGDTTKLYLLAGTTFNDVSIVTGYSVVSGDRWQFLQYGQRIIATQISNNPQYYDMGVSTLFANLGGSPPKAKYICGVRDFVVLGNTINSPQQLAWSGFNDSAGWTPGTNQSDTETLQGGGWINGMVGGEVGYIFQERAITRMTYIGPPLYFQFDLLEDGRGLAAPGSLIRVGSQMFFYAQDGFYVKDGDSLSTSIGSQRVDDWFAAHCQPSKFEFMTASADPANKLVIWSFVSTDAANATNPDTLLFYNWNNQEWSYAKVNHEMLFPALTVGLTLEQLSALYPNLETVPLSLDDRAWTGGASILAAFDTTHNLANFGGAPLAASLTTADFEGVEGKRSIIVNTRPLSDASSMTVTCESRERFADTVVNTAAATMQSNGDVPLLSSGRFHRLKLDIPAGANWTFMNGLDVDAVDDGEQ
jgi:hypothetical protein